MSIHTKQNKETKAKIFLDVLVYSHWLGPEPGPGPEPGRMGCMVLIRTFHTAPEQGHFSGPENVPGDEY